MSCHKFYLSSSEGYGFDGVTVCNLIRRVSVGERSDFMLVGISPHLSGQKYGLGSKSIPELIIAPRHINRTLFPINEWPMCIYVFRPLVVDDGTKVQYAEHEVKLIAWAELYRTAHEAAKKAPSSG